jgi:hypothetical protein
MRIWRWWQYGSYATIAWVFLITWLVNGYFDNLPKGGWQVLRLLGMAAALFGLVAIWVFLHRLYRKDHPRKKGPPKGKDVYKSTIVS